MRICFSPIIEMELYLVRHAQSLTNAGEAKSESVEDRENPALTKKGIAQAESLGEYYSGTRFDRIFSSGLKRALSTAEAVAVKQNTPCDVEVHPIFTECGISEEYEGTDFESIKKAYPLCVKASGAENCENFIYRKNNATDAENLMRAKKALAYLRERFTRGEKIMVVSHAAFLTSMVFSALGLTETEIFDIAFSNAGVAKIVFYKKGTGKYERDVKVSFLNRTVELIPNR